MPRNQVVALSPFKAVKPSKTQGRKVFRIVKPNQQAMRQLDGTIKNLADYVSSGNSAGNDGVRDAIVSLTGIRNAWSKGKLTSGQAKHLVNKTLRALTRACSSTENEGSAQPIDAQISYLNAATESFERFLVAMGWNIQPGSTTVSYENAGDERASHMTFVERKQQGFYSLLTMLALAGLRFTLDCSTVVPQQATEIDSAHPAEEIIAAATEAAQGYEDSEVDEAQLALAGAPSHSK